MSKLPVKTAAVLAALAAGLAGPASAHHSFAMFDINKFVTIDGTVKEFRWTNPHTFLAVYGALPGGKPETWALELTSPNNLLRMGWSKRSLSPGDHIKVELNPARNGEPAGALRKVTFVATGQVLGTHALAAEPLRRDLPADKP